MAGIYMGGRLPQIWLNIKRGNVEASVSSYIVFFLVTIWLLLIMLFVNLRSEDTFRFHLGLSLFMFIFALVGNSTYVGSYLIFIRVNSLEWCKIKPNLPWLVDAGGCVLLDAFILIQFIYFNYRNAARKVADIESGCRSMIGAQHL